MTEWHGGKGSKTRPTDKAKFDEGFDRIFRRKKKCDEKYCGGNVGDGTCYLCKQEKRDETEES